MHTPHIISTILLAVTCLCAEAADKICNFSSLPASDTIEIRFHSSGCFHDYTYDYTFQTGATASVSVASVTERFSLKNNHLEETRSVLGTVQLTAADVNGLDELMRSYRSQPESGCTTVDRITVSQLHEGKIIATERFVDGSCSAHPTNRFTTFPEIAWRLKQK